MFSVDHVIARAGVVAGEIAGVGGWRGADPFPDIDFAAAIAAGQTLLDSLGEGKSMMSAEGLDRSPVAPIAMARSAGVGPAGLGYGGQVSCARVAGGFQVVSVDGTAVAVITVRQRAIAEVSEASAEHC